MKTIIIIIAAVIFGTNIFSQTMFIDYTERTKENTATIHLIEAKLPIENEEFNDLSKAKVKLIRTIENYRTDGYTVQATSVSTHKFKGSLHYHYQYILQKTTRLDEFVNELDDAEGFKRQQMRKNRDEQILKQKPEGQLKVREQKRTNSGDVPLQPQAQPKPVE